MHLVLGNELEFFSEEGARVYDNLSEGFGRVFGSAEKISAISLPRV